ncbi:MAG: FadR/GntR family transcriptional regulator [Candidatus Adiutrix sp.]
MGTKSLSQRVEVKIKQLISEGHLKIGDRLPPERELAEAMNVSRHTLRAAIKSLEGVGLLKSRPGSGTFIFHDLADGEFSTNTMFSETLKMTEIFQLRWALEPAIAAAAISGATQGGLKKLKENLDRQLKAIESANTDLWAQADLDYHLLLSQLTGNSLFVSVIGNLAHCIALCVDYSHLNPARMKVFYEGHFGVYEAILNQDAKRAVFHMEEHLKLLPWQENLKVSTVVKG